MDVSLFVIGIACGVVFTHILYLTYFHKIILPEVDKIFKPMVHSMNSIISKIDINGVNETVGAMSTFGKMMNYGKVNTSKGI
jgi:hypothetical protein